MNLMDGFSVIIFLVLIYLLSKIIIEKNAQSISMAKILGYTNRRNQPAVPYVHVYRGRAVHLDQPAIGAGNHADSVPGKMLTSITGWITFYIDPKIFVEMFVIGVAAYAIVAAIEYRRIRKIPMDEALKNVE